MAHEDDLHIARIALDRGLLTKEQLQGALFEMFEHERATGERWPLGVMMVATGYFPEAVLLSVLAERVRAPKSDLTSSQMEDLDFGRILVLSGSLEPEQVNEALAVQQREWKAGSPSKRLGTILVELGYATSEQIQRALSYQRSAVLACGSCGIRFHATKASPRAHLRCPHCNGTLSRSADLEFDESIRLQETAVRPRRSVPVPQASKPVGEQAQIDRALALYARQMNLVPHDALTDAQRIQLEVSRFGLEIALFDVMKRFGILAPRQAAELERVSFASVVLGPGWTKQAVPGYRIDRKISVTGSSTIFAARPLFGEDIVAIKILHPDRARVAAVAERFRREAELLVRLDHPGILKGLETGVVPPPRPDTPGLHFLTMEYVDAESLDHLIQVKRALSPRMAVRMTAQVAHALMYMEKQGYLHRDVKPENILIDREGMARLSDLGLAIKTGAAKPEAADEIVGSASCISPEQARGEEPIGPESDIYSLGLTLYAMLVGRPAFSGERADEILKKRFGEGGTGSPSIEGIPAPPPILEVLRQMIEPDRRARIGSYAQLLETLRRI